MLAFAAAMTHASASAEVQPEEVNAALARWDLVTARALAERMLDEAPETAMSFYAAGLVASRDGRFDDAHVLLRRAVDLAPGFADAVALDAWVYLSEGDEAVAEQLLEDAARLDPAVPLVSAVRSQLEEAAAARAGRAGELRYADGTHEQWVDTLVRAVERGAPAAELARWFTALVPQMSPEWNQKAALGFVEGLQGGLATIGARGVELIGWHVEPDEGPGPDPWYAVVVVASRARGFGARTLAAMTETAAASHGLVDPNLIDPNLRAAVAAAPPAERAALARRLLDLPTRFTLRVQVAIHTTGDQRRIVGVMKNGVDLFGTAKAALATLPPTDPPPPADPPRTERGRARVWVAFVVVFLGSGTGLGAIMWWRTKRNRERRRSARLR